MPDNYLHSEVSKLIIQAYFKVYNTLGFGFLESVYRKALLYELREMDLQCSEHFPIKVYYEGLDVGLYYADIIVNDCLIIEIKAASSLCKEHELQLINYLKATDIEVGLLLNFGQIAEFKRKVFSGEFKNHNRS